MANKARVIFVDGTSQVVSLRPKATIAAERKFGADAQGAHQVEASMYMIWFTLGMPGGTDAFNTWLDTLDEVEQYEEDGTPADGATDPPEPVSSDPSPT